MLRLILTLAAAAGVFSCPNHDISLHKNILGKRSTSTQDWGHENSFDWGSINPNYTLCQTGTTQAPIPLTYGTGLSEKHIPTFDYPDEVHGNLYNWGYGPSFTVNTSVVPLDSRPSFTFDNETVHLSGWHIHAPGDHSVQGTRPKAELHLVHTDADGNARAVLAILIDPGHKPSSFFAQFGGGLHNAQGASIFPHLNSEDTIPMDINIIQELQEVAMFSEFWTYQGSLTSPPCTEGVRFFVSRVFLYVSNRADAGYFEG